MSFASPTAALEAIAVCLDDVSNRIHTGAAETGATLDCCCDECDGPLLRIESSTSRAKKGVASLYHMSRNRCEDIVLDIVVTYRTCFESFDGDGPDPVTLSNATTQGMALVTAWWEALELLVCCTGTNQDVRFQTGQDDPPDGGCAGWTLRLEADVSICGCA